MKRTYNEQMLKPSYHDYEDKTLSVRIAQGTYYYGKRVHRLIGLTFLGTTDVEHVSGDKEDNSVSNLRIK